MFDEKTRMETVGFSDPELYQDSTEVEFGSYYVRCKGYGSYQP